MTKPNSRNFFLATATACLLPTATLADISALDVWQSWKSISESMGQTVTVGSERMDGDTLILEDVAMAVDFPEGRASTTLDILEFRERSDGTVAITMAPDMPFSMSINPAEGEAVDLALVLRQTGLSIVASGEPDEIAFDYLATNFSFDLDTLVVDGEQMDVSGGFDIAGMNGQVAINATDGVQYSSQISADSLSYIMAFADPESGGQFDTKGQVGDLEMTSRVVVPEGFDPEDAAQSIGDGFELAFSMRSGASTGNSNFSDGSESFAAETAAIGTSAEIGISDGSVQYGVAANGISYNVQASQLPFPEVSLAFSEVAFDVEMPLVKSDNPKDFRFLMRLAGMEISEIIWNMLDPGQIMPRGPATISLDLDGQMNWLIDIMDPERSEEGDAMPGMVHSLKINELILAALGAEINGTGDFTFDNSDLETFGGIPAPNGRVDLNIHGANGLMDRLVQMGFLPNDQAMAGRMMLGLFARPSGGEDELESTIEVHGDGSVFANGQQLK